jgi:hypothetical protein
LIAGKYKTKTQFYEQENEQGETESSHNIVHSWEKAGYTGRQYLTPGNWGSGSYQSMTVLSTASSHYGTFTRRGRLTDVLRIKLTDVLYVPWIRQ